jgi:hypothetical protein
MGENLISGMLMEVPHVEVKKKSALQVRRWVFGHSRAV